MPQGINDESSSEAPTDSDSVLNGPDHRPVLDTNLELKMKPSGTLVTPAQILWKEHKLLNPGFVLKRGSLSKYERQVVNAAIKNFINGMEMSHSDFVARVHARDFGQNTTGFWSNFTYVLKDRAPSTIRDYIMRHYTEYKPGALTKAEQQEILDLVEEHGRKWTLIADHLNRSPEQIRIFYTGHLNRQAPLDDIELSTGPWTPEEEENFQNALDQFLSDNITVDYKAVAKAVGTRSAKQCADHARARTRCDATYRPRTSRRLGIQRVKKKRR